MMADEILAKLLKEAKQKPRNFVLAVNGKDIGIILSKKKISPAQVKEAKTRAKNATKFFTGIVESGPTGLAFKSVDPMPSSALPILKKYVAEEAKITLKATFEQVASLTEVNEEDDRFADVTGAKSAIDVKGRQQGEMDRQVQKLRDFVTEAPQLKTRCEVAFNEATQRWKAAGVIEKDVEKNLKLAEKAPVVDDVEVKRIKDALVDARKLSKDLFDARTEAKKNLDDVPKLTKSYIETLAAFDKLDPVKGFDARFELLQHGRIAAIAAVRQKLDEVYAATNKKLVILGRTADTFEGNDSWVAKNPKEGKRVLQEDDWSMSVNDAFIKAGVDQKADFAMISKFKDAVLKKIKDLLQNPGNRTPEELKKELRAFVKKEADPALFTGKEYNDGFAVSMVELEQLIDDGYVMMEHDTNAGSVKDLQDLKPTPVMVPSGKGQKIKEELSEAVKKREEKVQLLRKKINDEFVGILKVSKGKIGDSKPAQDKLRTLKMAMDENRWEDAGKALLALKKELA
jgi:hypothetical protein